MEGWSSGRTPTGGRESVPHPNCLCDEQRRQNIVHCDDFIRLGRNQNHGLETAVASPAVPKMMDFPLIPTLGPFGSNDFVSIGSDPLPPGQAWVISSGGADENPGLYQVNVTEGPGGGVKILNQPAPPPFKEGVRCVEQNLYAHARELVGDRDPRSHEFSVQLRAFDSAKSGSGVGVAVLVALCSSLLQKSIKGGLAVTGGLNLGGSIETIFNPVAVVEIAIEKGAASILMPISSRRQLNELPDDLAAKITVHYYLDARDALLKALAI